MLVKSEAIHVIVGKQTFSGMGSKSLIQQCQATSELVRHGVILSLELRYTIASSRNLATYILLKKNEYRNRVSSTLAALQHFHFVALKI